MQTIGKMSLHNGGGFVVKIEFDYMREDGTRATSKAGGSFPVGQTETADPGSLGVPNGAIVWLHADVVAGTDNVASQGFIYEEGNANTANYTITGVFFSNTLGLINVT